ncbi:MAG TPA: hypothetical protein VKC34_02585 [Blastocatellia bacterium]|nr:hypothetical protein [Blastocatellia bacterium]
MESSEIRGDAGRARLTATGLDAAKSVAQLLPEARAVTVESEAGRVELRPGAVWDRDKLLACPSENYVWHAAGENFYESPTDVFVRNEWLPALSRGRGRIVHLTPEEIAVVSGLFMSWRLFLRLSAARVALLYHENRSLMEVALRQTPPVLKLLALMRRAYPSLFAELASSEAGFVLSAFRTGGETESPASFIARALNRAGGLPEQTLGKVLRVAAGIGDLKIAGRVAGEDEAASEIFERAARSLSGCLAGEGIAVEAGEARRIVEELRAREYSASAMSELAMVCRMLVPTLNHLAFVVQSTG